MDISGGIPNRITPDPIIDCNFEIRFASGMQDSEVLGVLLEAFKKGYPVIDPTSIPLPFRQADLNFRYFPEVYLRNDRFQVGIAKTAISIACKTPYPGWKVYQPEIDEKVRLLFGIPGMVRLVERIGLRYINFFENFSSADQVFDSAMGCITLPQYTRRSFSVRSEFYKNGTLVILNASDNATKVGTSALGSLVDLDVSSSESLQPDGSFLLGLVDTLHRQEKEVFYSLLRKDLVDKFNPEYEGRQ